MTHFEMWHQLKGFIQSWQVFTPGESLDKILTEMDRLETIYDKEMDKFREKLNDH